MKPLVDGLRLAVVVPTLNEEARLGKTLASIENQADDAVEILVPDGGSTDGTRALAEEHGARVVVAPRRGRGCQVAAAVAQVTQEIVLVVHADMILPAGALDLVRAWLAEHPACPGGCLGHRFDNPSPFFRVVEWLDRRRARNGTSYGDQAQFFRRDLLARHGGFPDQPIMEDVELCRRLRGHGPVAYLDCPVLVSARRFERLGYWQTVVANLGLRRAYQRGGLEACWPIYGRYYGKRGLK